jgi:hypothetical protein
MIAVESAISILVFGEMVVSPVRAIGQRYSRENIDKCIDLRLTAETLDLSDAMKSHRRGRRSNRKEVKPNKSSMPNLRLGTTIYSP